MPKPSQSGKKRFFYNQNLKRDKSSKKYKNLTDHTIILIKRLEKEGMTKWIANALNKAQSKIKSYGITLIQMTSALEQKGLLPLTTVLTNNLVFVQRKGHNVSISTKRDIITTSKKIVISGVSSTEKKTSAPKKEAVAKKPATEKKTLAPKKEAVAKKPATEKKTSAPKKEAVAKKPATKKLS
jgi:hypothetical protein